MSQPIIDIRNVTKIFGDAEAAAVSMVEAGKSKAEVQAETGCVVGLKRVSLNIAPGEISVVMGLSGSGKSTLIRHVNRLIDPTAGEIYVHGQNVLDYSLEELRDFRRTKLAMVFQNFGLMPHRNVLENVAYGLEVRGVAKAKRLKTAASWIERVGLSGYEKVRPHEMSGGQQQRVGLARALAMDTEILLMDEAFSALDPLIRSGMQDELMTLQKELNKTILFITHDFDEAVRIGDSIAVLNDGEVVQTGKPEDIVLQPANDYVSDFVRDVNRARVIHIKSIMEKDVDEVCDLSVPQSACCEDVLPLFAEHDWVGVLDDEGNRVGRVTAKNIIKALARHSSATV